MDMNKLEIIGAILSFILIMFILLYINNNAPADPETVDPTGIRFEQSTAPEFMPDAPVAARSAILR